MARVCHGCCVMQKITALKTQVHNRNRVSIFVDGEFALGVPWPVAEGLGVGQTISAETLTELQRRADEHAGLEKAMRLLVNRPRSSAEIRRALRKQQLDDTQIDAVIQQLSDKELLDDAAFVDYWIDQRNTFRPRSRLALRQELMQKGIARSLIDTPLEAVDEEANARTVAEKQAGRYRQLSADAFRQKMLRFLTRRGYSYGIAKQVTLEIWQATKTDQTT